MAVLLYSTRNPRQLKARKRELVWRDATEDVVKHSHQKRVIRCLERLLAQWSRSV